MYFLTTAIWIVFCFPATHSDSRKINFSSKLTFLLAGASSTSHSQKCQFPSVNEQARSNATKPNPTKRADVVLSCLLPRPALKCMLERAASRPQLGRQGTARPAARSEPAVHRKTLPSLSQHQQRQSMRGKLSLSLLSPSPFLPTWLL